MYRLLFKMKKFSAYLVLFFVTLHFSACNKTDDLKSTSESALSMADSILLTYGYNPAKALAMLDSLSQSGGLSDYRTKLYRGRILSGSVIEQHLDTALVLSKELLLHDSVVDNPVEQENVFNQLIDISRKRHDDEQYLNWSLQKAELCRRQGEETELLRTEAEIGLVLTHLGQIDEGYAKINHSIKLLDVSGSVDKMDAFIVATKRLITVLEEQNRYSDIIPSALSILHRLDDYQSHPNNYAEDSYRLVNVKADRDRYVDFCRAQAYGYLVLAYAKLGNRKQAYMYLNHFDATQYGTTLSAHKMISPAYLLLGEYDKWMSTYEATITQMGADTINGSYLGMLRGRAVMAEARGQLVESNDYWRRYATLSKLLSDSLHASKIHQYAVRYHAQEQRMLIERKEQSLARMRIYIVAAVLLASLAICFAIYFFYRRRIDNKKNKIIVKQISDSINLKQDFIEHQQKPDVASNAPEGEAPTAAQVNNMSSEELYNYLSSTIISEKLYLDPYFGRQTVVKRFGITEKRIGSAFSKGSADYKSLPGFIREQRLLYACKLLHNHPEMSVKEIAAASGFSSQPRFNIDFKERFSFSPSEYRNLASE